MKGQHKTASHRIYDTTSHFYRAVAFIVHGDVSYMTQWGRISQCEVRDRVDSEADHECRDSGCGVRDRSNS